MKYAWVLFDTKKNGYVDDTWTGRNDNLLQDAKLFKTREHAEAVALSKDVVRKAGLDKDGIPTSIQES
jgi:hypothetical protein